MQRARFENLVADALGGIPRRFREAMANVAIVVEDEPSPALLADMEIEPPDTLLGLYQGTPLTERGWGYGNTLPDRILLFQGPHERAASNEADLVVAIGETLIHEVGHYFGMSEEEIEAIEERVLAGRGPMIPARKHFGQHFLEPAWVDKVIRAIAPAPDETFIEIGPGRGALTRPLAARAARVLACEIDRDLSAALRDESIPRVTVVEGDFLDADVERLRAAIAEGPPGGRLRVAGNLPYNIGSPILFTLAGLHASGLPIADATVMLQREVADRLVAPPGGKEYGVLSVLIGHRAAAERVLSLPPGAFRPPPNVRSALVRLTFHAASPPVKDERVFHATVKGLFSRRRKTLANALRACPLPAGLEPGDALERAGLDGRRRPETLSLAELARLSDTLADPLPIPGR